MTRRIVGKPCSGATGCRRHDDKEIHPQHTVTADHTAPVFGLCSTHASTTLWQDHQRSIVRGPPCTHQNVSACLQASAHPFCQNQPDKSVHHGLAAAHWPVQHAVWPVPPAASQANHRNKHEQKSSHSRAGRLPSYHDCYHVGRCTWLPDHPQPAAILTDALAPLPLVNRSWQNQFTVLHNQPKLAACCRPYKERKRCAARVC